MGHKAAYTCGIYDACYYSYSWSGIPGIYLRHNILGTHSICPATQILGKMSPKPHFILHWYFGFDGLLTEHQLVSNITLPAVLPDRWDIMSLHFQIRSAKQISFSQEATPFWRPELQEQATELISRGQGLSPSQAALLEQGAGRGSSYQAPLWGLRRVGDIEVVYSNLTTKPPGLLLSWHSLDDDLSSRRLSELFRTPRFSDTSSDLSGVFAFWRRERQNRKERERNQTYLK